jgi:hypothetical protein
MNKQFVTKNFLLIVVLLSVGFAVAMRATVYQKDPAAVPVPALSVPPEQFSAYWQRDQSEETAYDFQINNDHVNKPVTLVFSAIDFRTDAHQPARTAEDRTRSVRVLACQLISPFPDSVGNRQEVQVFTPVNRSEFLETIQVYAALQTTNDRYAQRLDYQTGQFVLSRQQEDKQRMLPDYKLEKTLLEDELWTRIRLNPAKLPIGHIRLLPSLTTRQGRLWAEKAIATRADSGSVAFSRPGLQAYSVRFDKSGRTLTIWYARDFPHRIAGWEDQTGTHFSRATHQSR